MASMTPTSAVDGQPIQVIQNVSTAGSGASIASIHDFYHYVLEELARGLKTPVKCQECGDNRFRSSLQRDLSSLYLWAQGLDLKYFQANVDHETKLQSIVVQHLAGIMHTKYALFDDNHNPRIRSLPDAIAKLVDDWADEHSETGSNASDSCSDSEVPEEGSNMLRMPGGHDLHQRLSRQLHNHVSCLMELLPTLEHCCQHEQASSPNVETSVADTGTLIASIAHPYTKQVQDKFTQIAPKLAQRLGEANWSRFQRLQNLDAQSCIGQDVTIQAPISAGNITFKMLSEFQDSGLGASLPAATRRAASVASHTSFISTSSAAQRGALRVPALPEAAKAGQSFQCISCAQTLSNIRDRVAWKRHVFSDIQPYICTFDDCAQGKNTFATRALWGQHEFQEHRRRELWDCFQCKHEFTSDSELLEHLSDHHDLDTTLSSTRKILHAARKTVTNVQAEQCPMCLKAGFATIAQWTTHVSRHMEEIALIVLPSSVDSDEESGGEEVSNTSELPESASPEQTLSASNSTHKIGVLLMGDSRSDVGRCYNFQLDQNLRYCTSPLLHGSVMEAIDLRNCVLVVPDAEAHRLVQNLDLSRCFLLRERRKFSYQNRFLQAESELLRDEWVALLRSRCTLQDDQNSPLPPEVHEYHQRALTPLTRTEGATRADVSYLFAAIIDWACLKGLLYYLDWSSMPMPQPALQKGFKFGQSFSDMETFINLLDPLQNKSTKSRIHDAEHEGDLLEHNLTPVLKDSSSKDVQADLQNQDEDYTIKCICPFEDDDGNTVYCEQCQTWQHIHCYYAEKRLVPETHFCVDCHRDNLSAKAKSRQFEARKGSNCYCGGAARGQMVACSNKNCSRVWVHLDCIALNNPPDHDRWQCGDCQEKPPVTELVNGAGFDSVSDRPNTKSDAGPVSSDRQSMGPETAQPTSRHFEESKLESSSAIAEAIELKTMYERAVVIQDQGNYIEAERLYRTLLASQESMLGIEHQMTLKTMNNIARMLQCQGKSSDAEQLFRRVLTTRQRMLGEEHSDTLASMHDLAMLLMEQGKLGGAEPLVRTALAGQERELGEKHPSTLASMHKLARLLMEQGKHEEAEQLSRTVLAVRETELGEEHPSTLASMHNLATVLMDQGKHNEAEQLYRTALAGLERALGKEHPSTLLGIHNLANLLVQQRKYNEAESLYRTVLAGRETVLGKEHPDTLVSMYHLAMVLIEQGKLSEAEPLLRTVLAVRERVLGKEHPDTLQSMHNLAGPLVRQHKYDEAEQLYRTALAGRERMLGVQHRHTWTTRVNLEALLRHLGKHQSRNRKTSESHSAVSATNPETQAVSDAESVNPRETLLDTHDETDVLEKSDQHNEAKQPKPSEAGPRPSHDDAQAQNK